jgi:hypothetical protein
MSRLRSSPRLRSALFVLLPAILLAAGSPQTRVAVAYLGPFLLLLTSLLADCYLGESLIRAPRPAVPRRREPVPAPAFDLPQPRARRAPLLAFALAGRAPPVPPRRTRLCSI